MRIAILESAHSTSNHYIFVAIVAAFQRRSDVTELLVLDRPTALAQLRAPVDALLIVGGEEVDSVVVQSLRSYARITAVWFTEDPYEFSRHVTLIDKFDVVFTNDRNSATRYGAKAQHLPLAAPASLPDIPAFADRRYDLSFIGTAWPNRARLLSELDDVLQGLRSKITLSSNVFLNEHLQGIPLRYPMSPGVDFEDFMRISAQSRLSLFVDRHFTSQVNSDATSDTPGPRLFEVAAVGACIMADDRVAGDLASLHLTRGQDYVAFSTADECRALLADFTSDPAPFARIARSLQDKVHQAHLYDHRVDTILETLILRLSDVPPVAPAPTTHVLILAHNLPRFSSLGGSELYLEKLLAVLKADAAIDFRAYILARDTTDSFGTKFVLLDDDGQLLEEIKLQQPLDSFSLESPEFNARLQAICTQLKIGYVFVNHLIGFPASLIATLRLIGIPYAVVLHDFYFVCDSFNLIDHRGRYCGIDRPDFDSCQGCTEARLRADSESQFRRRTIYADILRRADRIVTNQEFVFEMTRKALSLSRTDVTIIAPPLVFEPAEMSAPPQRTKLHVAVVGNLYLHKGALDFADIVEQTSELDIVYEVFGKFDEQLRDRLKDADVVFHGAYELSSYPKARIAQCDCALYLSKWPETYCMSLTETNELGLVPIAYAIGAFASRITDDYGILVAPKPFAAVQALRDVVRDRSLLARRRVAIPAPVLEHEFAPRYAAFFSALRGRFSRPLVEGPAENSFAIVYPCESPRWSERMSFWTRMVEQGAARRVAVRDLVIAFVKHLRMFGLLSAMRTALRWAVR